MNKINGVKKTILTAWGEKTYQGTEVEDSKGDWNDEYNVKEGYSVVHDGENHHVYWGFSE